MRAMSEDTQLQGVTSGEELLPAREPVIDREDIPRPAEASASAGETVDTAYLSDQIHRYWQDVDPSSPEMAYLCRKLKRCTIDKKGMLLMTTIGGGTFCAMAIPQGNGRALEFIGKTNGMTKFGKIPLSDDDAEAIIAAARMRGWKSINIHGSIEDKDRLWLAAQAQGLSIKGYQPTAETRSAWEKSGGKAPTQTDVADDKQKAEKNSRFFHRHIARQTPPHGTQSYRARTPRPA